MTLQTGSLTLERSGPVALLTLQRPDRRNAIDDETAHDLLRAYRRFEADGETRVLVLTGEGEDFCAGADLQSAAALAARLHTQEGAIGFSRLTPTKPAIAAIDGWCIGAGMDLAVWCDLRVATTAARFGFFERRWGIPSMDGYSQRLPRLIGLSRALDLMLTGREVAADEALGLGLVNKVVAPGEHLRYALELAAIIAGYPQPGLLATRRAAIEGLDGSLRDGLALEEALAAEPLERALAELAMEDDR